MDKFLEAWQWKHANRAGMFNTLTEGWVLTAKDGLYPQHEYDVHGHSGVDGSYLGGGWAKGVEPSATFQIGDSSPVEVAKKVEAFTRSLKLGGRPDVAAPLMVKPYGAARWFTLPAAPKTFRVEYEETGHVASVTVEWISGSTVWGRGDAVPGGVVSDEAVVPW